MSTIRQMIVVKKLSEIIRNPKAKKKFSMGEILREAGYSKLTSMRPGLVTKSQGYQEELMKLIPENLLAEKHNELLNSYKINRITFELGVSDQEINEFFKKYYNYKIKKIIRSKRKKKTICYYWTPDSSVRLNAIDMAYKLWGKYPSKNKKAEETPHVVKIINYKD